jgi:hypothetical protein
MCSRACRLYPRLDASRPEGVTGSITTWTIQALHTLVVQFTCDIDRRAIALQELDFSPRAHTKMWRPSKRLIRPPHVRRSRRCVDEQAHTFWDTVGLERFSEDEANSEEEAENDDDLPLAVRLRKSKAKAVVRDAEDDYGDDVKSAAMIEDSD